MVIDDTGSVEDIHAFIYCKKWRFGQVLPMPHSLTDSQSKDRATQLLTKYKSGALVTQFLDVLCERELSFDIGGQLVETVPKRRKTEKQKRVEN